MGRPVDCAPESLEEAFEAHLGALVERFGAGAQARGFFAPGRVNLMGAHLDYNGGPVLPTAIDRGTFVAVRPIAAPLLRLASTVESGVHELPLDALPERRLGAWVDYPLGVARALVEDAGRAGLRGLELLFGGNLAVGAGLSSSASICVVTALALDRAWGLGLDPVQRVEVALRAERAFVGVQCGIMDPFAVGLARPGHLLWLDCKDRSHEHVPFDPQACRLAVADTGVRRELATGEFNRRVAECRAAFEALAPHQPGATCLRDIGREVFTAERARLEPVVARRAEHVVGEVERTFAAREALRRGDLGAMGALMLESHASLRELYEVSCPELDQLVDDAARSPGCLGGRLTGAGFGGCAVFLVEPGAERQLRAAVSRGFEARFGRTPRVDVYGGDQGPRELAV